MSNLFLEDCAACGADEQQLDEWKDLLTKLYLVECRTCGDDSGWQSTAKNAANAWNKKQTSKAKER